MHTLQHIMSEPEEITTMSGQKLQLKMSVDYISFSAHTDYQQTSEFIRALKPPHVVIRFLHSLSASEQTDDRVSKVQKM